MNIHRQALDAAARELQWDKDIQVLVLGGYILQNSPTDPDRFTDACADFASAAGLDADFMIHLLSIMAAEIEPTSRQSFTEYLQGVVSDFRKQLALPSPSPSPSSSPSSSPSPSPAPSRSVSQSGQFRLVAAAITADPDVFDIASHFLNLKWKVPDRKVGEVLARFCGPVDSDPTITACVDVVNAETRPTLEPYLLHNNVFVAGAKPSLDLNQPFVFRYRNTEYTVRLVRPQS